MGVTFKAATATVGFEYSKEWSEKTIQTREYNLIKEVGWIAPDYQIYEEVLSGKMYNKFEELVPFAIKTLVLRVDPPLHSLKFEKYIIIFIFCDIWAICCVFASI